MRHNDKVTCKFQDFWNCQKVNLRVNSRVAKRLKTEDLRKLGNFQKILVRDGEILTFVLENREKSAVKHSIEKIFFT